MPRVLASHLVVEERYQRVAVCLVQDWRIQNGRLGIGRRVRDKCATTVGRRSYAVLRRRFHDPRQRGASSDTDSRRTHRQPEQSAGQCDFCHERTFCQLLTRNTIISVSTFRS